MKRTGQSILEYLLIAVLVIIGVVIMGAYVLRSTNAHFKLWDEGVVDTFQEEITQVSQNKVPYIPTNCNCTDTPGSCGAFAAGIQCAGNERISEHLCTPSHCDERPTETCNYDQTCCLIYLKGGCGILPAVQSGRPASTTITATASNGLPSNETCVAYHAGTCTTTADCTIAGTYCTSVYGGTKYCYYNSCYAGQYTWATECSDLPVACCNDTACDPECTGIDLFKDSFVFCPGAPNSLNCPVGSPSNCVPGLEVNTPITYVADSTSCSTQPCYGYCNQDAGFFPQKAPDGTILGCVNDFHVAPIVKFCNVSGVWQKDACPPIGNTTGPVLNRTYPDWDCIQSWPWYPQIIATNKCSYSICPTQPNVSIATASAGVTSITSTCSADSCCDDHAIAAPCALCNKCDDGNKGAIPACQCQVNLTVTAN